MYYIFIYIFCGDGHYDWCWIILFIYIWTFCPCLWSRGTKNGHKNKYWLKFIQIIVLQICCLTVDKIIKEKMLLLFSAFMIFQSRNRSTGIIFYKFYCLRNHFLVVVVALRVMIVINSQKNIFNEDYTSLTQIIVPTWSCLDWTEK